MTAEPVTLSVAKAYPNDDKRGVVRIDREALVKLMVSPGDIVEIVGQRSTAAVVWRAEEKDQRAGLIRMDGFMRQNAGASIGDRVVVRRVEKQVARRVVLAPAQGSLVDPGLTPEDATRQMVKRALVAGDLVPLVRPGLAGAQTFSMVALEVEPRGVVVAAEDTRVEVREKADTEVEARPMGATYEDIGGLSHEIQRVREMIELPLKHPEVFQKLGVEPPKGVLLHGSPGTGKTLIAKAVANESGATFYSLAGPEIVSRYYGESEQRLREIFESARKNAPSIIFIDEVDSIAPKREDVTGEVERRIVAQLLAIMDGLQEKGQVIVIGATNRIGAIDPALRRPGRFDREIELGVPERDDRLEILQIHTRHMPLASDVDLGQLAALTHGFVGADLSALSKEAALKALRRVLPEMDMEKEQIPPEVLEKILVTMNDFREALREIEPSALREVLVEIPDVKWEEIGGLSEVKQEVREMVEWPLRSPERFHRMGIRPPKGILLFGPPGTGKTLIAKAVANESGANFITVRGPELFSKWVGESERAVREIFRKAQQVAPCIIFFDEIDSMAPARGSDTGGSGVTERVVNQLLSEMDGLETLEGVMVLGATNRPDILDPALIRPGRFDRLLLVGPPNREGRREILKIHMEGMPVAGDVQVDQIVDITEGYVGSDLESLCREAAMGALRENPEAQEVGQKHFLEAIKRVKATVNEHMMQYYEKVREAFEGGLAASKAKSFEAYR